MFKNMKLGQKLGFAFGILIVLMAFLGVMSIFSMAEVKRETDKLTEEYIPAVELAGNIERLAGEARYNMLSFQVTNNENTYNKARSILDELETHAASLEKLINESTYMKAQSETIDKLLTYRDSYEQLAQLTLEIQRKRKLYNDELGEHAVAFNQNTESYINDLTNIITTEIRSNANREQVIELFRKLDVLNDTVKNMGNLRVNIFKALNENDVSYFQVAIPEIRRMQDTIDALIERWSPKSVQCAKV
jgi:methyl-accepting chemotaxis protein